MPEQRVVLERLYEAELDHLHELKEKYHAHLDRSVTEMPPEAEKLLADWLFHGLTVSDEYQHPAHLPVGAGDGVPHARPFPQAGRRVCPRAWKKSFARNSRRRKTSTSPCWRRRWARSDRRRQRVAL